MLDAQTISDDPFNFECALSSLAQRYLETSKIRPEILFKYFLPTGYRHTTLSSVRKDLFDMVILAKVHLGMIITLYDDLSDHPGHRNARLLNELYQLNIGSDRVVESNLREAELGTLALARYLFSSLASLLTKFPYHKTLKSVLVFDIEQFYSSNKYSDLMMSIPSVSNLSEMKTLGPHNMGIVAAGTIDLMASYHFEFHELGHCREVFLLGQRLGRISNMVFTYHREQTEGDGTNEIAKGGSDYHVELLREFNMTIRRVRSLKLTTFNVPGYADGLAQLHTLHSYLEGKI